MSDKRDYATRAGDAALSTTPLPYTVFDTFSGIGGFSLGLEATGRFQTVAFCERDTFCQQVLGKRWPGTPIFEDIADVSRDALDARGIPAIDVITAGFPCQPFSKAGKRGGITDERFLWPELFRVIADIRPRVVILENSDELLTSHRGIVWAGILYDLFKIGFDVEWAVVSAASFGAPHQRDRLWAVAHTHSQRQQQPATQQKSGADKKRHDTARKRSGQAKFHAGESGVEAAGNATEIRRGKILCADLKNRCEKYQGWESALDGASHIVQRLEQRLGEPAICGVDDGVPHRVDRLGSLGNAVLPQIPEWIGHCLIEAGVLK